MPRQVVYDEGLMDEDYPVVVKGPQTRKYAYTMKKTRRRNREEVQHYHYINHCNVLKRHGCRFLTAEFEETSGLHVHGVVELPELFNFKCLRYRGWHLCLKEIYDEDGWKDYCEKDKFLKPLPPPYVPILTRADAVGSGEA